jgi:hypothetical protein
LSSNNFLRENGSLPEIEPTVSAGIYSFTIIYFPGKKWLYFDFMRIRPRWSHVSI